jgi:signal peptidase I
MKFTTTVRWILTASAAVAALGAAAGERPVSREMYDAAVVDALAVAAQRPDLSVVRISGRSMLPFFSDESVIVMKKIDAARMRIGMIAIYVNRFGEKVAHRVIARVDRGWQVQGYGNDEPDSTVVNNDNLLGVVYATFHSAGRPSVTVDAANVAAIQTVYAAPAK